MKKFKEWLNLTFMIFGILFMVMSIISIIAAIVYWLYLAFGGWIFCIIIPFLVAASTAFFAVYGDTNGGY